MMFDFTLPTVLLYSAERQQYDEIMKHPPPTATPLTKQISVKEEEVEEKEEEEEEPQ